MISTVYRPRRTKNGKTVVNRVYRGRYRLDPNSPLVEVSLGTSDKRVAEQKLAEIIKEKQWEAAGIIAPKLQRDSAQKGLREHLTDFTGDLTSLGRAHDYIRKLTARIPVLLDACAWKYAGDVNPDDFTTWRTSQKKLSPKTVNEYLNALNALLNWMVRQGRLAANPIKLVPKVDVRGKQQRRRAYTDDELNRLLKVADPEYRLLYMTAAYTGLRLGELSQMVWGDLKLDDPQPRILLRALTAKNRREAAVPLHPMLMKELAAAKAKRSPAVGAVFLHCHSATISRRTREDLEKAGITRIDAMGRKLDFHALRYTFATKLASSGVSQRLAQELAAQRPTPDGQHLH